MSLNGFEVLFYTSLFVVPGFLINAAITSLVPAKDEPQHVLFLRFIYLSLLNFACCSWLIYLIAKSSFLLSHPVYTALAWFAVLFVSPLLLGAIGGRLRDKGVIRRLLQQCGYNPIHPIPTAWDYAFHKMTSAVWVIVTLKDGSRVAGLFGHKSFASSATGERDLYIQQVYEIPNEGPWKPRPRSGGILLRGDQIGYIEFRDHELEETNGRPEISGQEHSTDNRETEPSRGGEERISTPTTTS